MAWGAAVGLGIVLGAFGLVTAAVLQAVRPVRFHVRGAPEADGLACEDIGFCARDGVRLAGWWAPADGNRGTVVLCHGYPSNRSDVAPMIPFLHEAGYNVLAFDFRRLGDSGGRLCTIGLDEPLDLLGAVDEAAARSRAPISVLGISMGAAVSLMAAAREPRIRAVVADSPYAALDRMCERRWAALPRPLRTPVGAYTAWLGRRLVGRPLSEASPLDAAHRIAPRPLLLIHSRFDRLIPPADSEDILAAAAEPKTLWLTDASGHVRTYGEFPDEYQRRVLAFLDAVPALNAASPPAGPQRPGG